MLHIIAGGSAAAFVIGKTLENLTYLEDPLLDGGCTLVRFQEFASNVKTGDLIITSSTSPTSVTRYFTKSMWTHCGVAIVGENGRIMEWSAHNSNEGIKTARGDESFGGIQYVNMDMLASMSGTIFWRPLTLSEDQRDKIKRFADNTVYNVKFSPNAEFLAYLGGPFSSAFSGYGEGVACTHAVVLAYVAAGVIALTKDVSLYAPIDFSNTGCIRWLVPIGSTRMVLGYDARSLVNLPRKNRSRVFKL